MWKGDDDPFNEPRPVFKKPAPKRKGRPKLHEHYQTRTYQAWARMKQLCDNPKATGYEYVGGRGITYDERWRVFTNFLEDMGEMPPGASLKRITPSQPYSRHNCLWKTKEPKDG